MITVLGVDQPIRAVVGAGSVPGPDALGAVLGFRWDGSTYQPASQSTEVANLKFFVGPVDPADVVGVVLAVDDQWIPTA